MRGYGGDGYLRFIAGGGYLVVVCYVGWNLARFEFGISVGVIWILLI